jgi:hypothetical protein
MKLKTLIAYHNDFKFWSQISALEIEKVVKRLVELQHINYSRANRVPNAHRSTELIPAG